MSATEDTTALYGFTPLPASLTNPRPSITSPAPTSPSDHPIPSTPLAQRINAYARRLLSPQTYNHSLRVYTYALAIARQAYPQYPIPQGSKVEETWFLTAMLHDIGTTPEHLAGTKLSFEFWGGYHALKILQDAESTEIPGSNVVHGSDSIASRAQAEGVAEAIIRHQDVQDKGFVTLVTRLVHWGTLLDNIGANRELVHPETIRNVNEVYDRRGWSGCFRDTVVKEKQLKGWAMVSRIEGFEEDIEANGKGLMRAWDG